MTFPFHKPFSELGATCKSDQLLPLCCCNIHSLRDRISVVSIFTKQNRQERIPQCSSAAQQAPDGAAQSCGGLTWQVPVNAILPGHGQDKQCLPLPLPLHYSKGRKFTNLF